jgi:putative MATE family efflux protein
MGLSAIFTATGDTRTPMIVSVTLNVLNVIVDPFLIFGWAGLPRLGVAGAGLATLLCHGLGLAFLLALYRRRRLGFPRAPLLRWYGVDAWGRMLRIGIPSGFGEMTRPLSTLFLLKVVATFGPAGVAAFGITVRALSLLWLFYASLATAISTLTGQSLGRSDAEGVRRLVWKGARLSLGLTLLIGIPYFVWARQVVGIFEPGNELVLQLGETFVRMLVITCLATSISMVWSAVMTGAGDTRPPMLIALISNWVVKLPLAYFLAIPLGIGVEGIYWAMAISLVFEAAALLLAYRRDRWTHTEV